jgi:hypothetical protein
MDSEGFIIEILKRIYYRIFPPKPKLTFEEKDMAHWYNLDESQSGIIVEMYLTNRGNQTTTIRKVDIINMNPDHTQYKRRVKNYQIELSKGKDWHFRETFFFNGAYLRYPKIEFELEITHSEGKEILKGESKLIKGLARARNSRVDN